MFEWIIVSILLASNLVYAGDENSGPLASTTYVGSQGIHGQVQHRQDVHLTELLHEVDEYETKVCESCGMITGALTGAGTMFVLALSLKGILNPIALAILGVSMLPIQVGIGSCIGRRCKTNMRINSLHP